MLEFDLKDKSIPKWLIKKDLSSDVILSSRARIARNIKGYSYLHKMKDEDREEIINIANDAIKNINSLPDTLIYVKLNSQSQKFRKFLKERFLATDYLLQGKNKEVIFDKNENINIMINEEDHIRLQAIYPDLNIKKAYNKILRIERELENYIDFDFNTELGYLTSCPTNVGTGLRVSVMLHLPALVLSHRIKEITDNLIESGFAIRGFYGEGTKFSGDLYQISNQTTLGVTEKEIIDKVENIVLQIEKLEIGERKKLFKNKKIYDKIIKSYLLLKNAYSISLEESMEHLSLLRLGEALNYIKIPDKRNFNKLLIMMQPMHLIYLDNIKIEAIDRSIENKLRANLIKKFMQKGKVCLKNLLPEHNRL